MDHIVPVAALIHPKTIYWPIINTFQAHSQE